MKKEIRYAYHVESNKVVHISEAERGLRCECKCLDCGSNLEAVKGKERTHFFRHANGKNCSGETVIHLFAKQVIAGSNNINLPNGHVLYENVRVEKPLDTKRPDLTVSVGGEDLHFEIKVSNAVKEHKRQFYCDGKHKCIEIDLSDRNLWLLSPEELRELILAETYNKCVIYWEEESAVVANGEKVGIRWLNLLGIGLILFALLFLFKLAFSKKRY